jgi:hypothetical protein
MDELFSCPHDNNSLVAPQYRRHILVDNKEPFVNSTQQAKPQLLSKGSVFVSPAAIGTQILCEKGTLWLTQDNDVRDIVIAAGEQFAADREGSVLVYALADASFSVASALPGPAPSFLGVIAHWFGRSGSAKRALVMSHG